MHDRAELVAAPLHHARCYVTALREASSRQGQGYGKLILALALEECRRLGLARVLATCLEDNLASPCVRGTRRGAGSLMEDDQ